MHRNLNVLTPLNRTLKKRVKKGKFCVMHALAQEKKCQKKKTRAGGRTGRIGPRQTCGAAGLAATRSWKSRPTPQSVALFGDGPGLSGH